VGGGFGGGVLAGRLRLLSIRLKREADGFLETFSQSLDGNGMRRRYQIAI